jgi:hypothetical protein
MPTALILFLDFRCRYTASMSYHFRVRQEGEAIAIG